MANQRENQGHAQLRKATKNGFRVHYRAENGEKLSNAKADKSNDLFSSRANAVNNILAHLNLFHGEKILVKEFDGGGHKTTQIDEFYIKSDGSIFREAATEAVINDLNEAAQEK